MKPNITAALIVKNEAHVIARTIAAVAPYVSGVVIVDTGSTDDTINAADDACSSLGLALFVTTRPWVDYAHNRSELLSIARVDSLGEGYTWILDADEVAAGTLPPELEDGPAGPNAREDGYMIARMLDSHEVWGIRLFSNRKPWRYENAVHELPVCEGASVGRLTSLWVENRNDGAQGTLDQAAVSARYSRDAEHFAALVAADPTDTRSAYYLAQSLRDAGRHPEAYAAYQRRGEMVGGFQEERYLSLLMVARYLRTIQPAPSVGVVVRAFTAAIEARPIRHEAMVELAGYLNDVADIGNPGSEQVALTAMAWAHRAHHTPPSSDLFLVHRPSYQWRPAFELARSSDLAEWHDVAQAMAQYLLGTTFAIGEDERATLERIARIAPPPL